MLYHLYIYILIVVLKFVYSHIFVATLKQKVPRTGWCDRVGNVGKVGAAGLQEYKRSRWLPPKPTHCFVLIVPCHVHSWDPDKIKLVQSGKNLLQWHRPSGVRTLRTGEFIVDDKEFKVGLTFRATLCWIYLAGDHFCFQEKATLPGCQTKHSRF